MTPPIALIHPERRASETGRLGEAARIKQSCHVRTHGLVWWILIKLSSVLDVIRRDIHFLKDFSFNISQRLALFPLRRSVDLRLRMAFFKHLQ